MDDIQKYKALVEATQTFYIDHPLRAQIFLVGDGWMLNADLVCYNLSTIYPTAPAAFEAFQELCQNLATLNVSSAAGPS